MGKELCQKLAKDGVVPFARLGTTVVEKDVQMVEAYRKLLKRYLGLTAEQKRTSPLVTAVLKVTHQDKEDPRLRATAYKTAGNLMQVDHYECDAHGRMIVPIGRR